jgi:transposase-like protein
MQHEASQQIIREFKLRQSRQLLAIPLTVLLMIFLALLHKRPDLFGELPRDMITAGQLAVIAVFVVFSFVNWRCPACGKFQGGDVYRIKCKKCGSRLG